MVLGTSDLDQFVRRSDELGGPGTVACTEYWAGLEYRPDTVVDETLDPFSTEYIDQQLAVYREMSGREFDQLSNEHTTIDVAFHAAAKNPYANLSPGGLSLHVERLSRALRLANPPVGGHLLDMGCGWGLSSEVASYSGLRVTAVDVNPDFVDLVNRRAKRLGHNIVAVHGAFDTFSTNERFDTVLFYECFHHALRPWDLLARMRGLLKPEGRLMLAGEPINDIWWKYWGMRLDPVSVYCIRKFGWLESGWSKEFLASAFRKAGLSFQLQDHPDPEIGFTVLGSPRTIGHLGVAEVNSLWQHSGWVYDGGYLLCSDQCRLTVEMPDAAEAALLGFQNFRGRAVRLKVSNGSQTIFDRELPPGRNNVELDRTVDNRELTFEGELWSPDAELRNGDTRQLSLHLEGITFR